MEYRSIWRLAGYREDEGPLLLAGNVALLDAVEHGHAPPTLRWYRYLRPCLVLGYGQPLAAVDLAACADQGVEVLRRPAGGAAVLADDGLLGLAIALPLPHPLVSSDLTESYRWLGEALAGALARLGVPARVISLGEARADAAQVRAAARAVDRLRGQACFGSFSPYEVAVGPGKVIGLAQVRRRGAVLYQVGILLRSAADLLAGVLNCAPVERAALAAALAERTADLQHLLGRSVHPAEVMHAVEAELTARYGITLAPAPLSAAEVAAAVAALPRVRAAAQSPQRDRVASTL